MNLEFTWTKTCKHGKFDSLYHEQQNFNFLVTWLLKTTLNLLRRFCWFFLKISVRYVLLCFVFFLPLLWQWAVNLSVLPEDGDKKTAYGNTHLLLPDRLQMFRSLEDENSLWGCFLCLGFVLCFLCFLCVVTIYCMTINPRHLMCFCVCGENVFSFTSV